MPKFFIGCPIKKMRGTAAIGVTARIVSMFTTDDFDAEARLDATVRDNALVGCKEFKAGEVAGIKLSQWEPIVPDGMKPVEADDLLCLPNGKFNDIGILKPFKEEAEA